MTTLKHVVTYDRVEFKVGKRNIVYQVGVGVQSIYRWMPSLTYVVLKSDGTKKYFNSRQVISVTLSKETREKVYGEAK